MRVYKFLTTHFALKSLYERRLKISTLDDLNDPFELLPYELSDQKSRWALHGTKRQLGQGRGLICFSGDWIDPVIWAHYADKHRGVCLGFDVFDDLCKRVNYEPARLPFPEPPLTVEHTEAMLFTKFSNWSYEQEIRIWTDLSESEDGLYYKEFDETLVLKEVIVGARSTVPREAVLRATGRDSNIELIKARPGFKKFEVVVDQRGLK